MATTEDNNKPKAEAELIDSLVEFYQTYYRGDILTLANEYPNENRSLSIDFRDIETFNAHLADDYLDHPLEFNRYFKEALLQFDLPVDMGLIDAHVRVYNLPEPHTYYPGEFSPTDHAGRYRSISGEVSKATDVYSKLLKGVFECKLCATTNTIHQIDSYQEPHECAGCERQGPFTLDHSLSEFVDAQQLRIQTPPEVASGAGTDLDVFIEDDIVDTATVGDRVTVSGVLQIEQQSKGKQRTATFNPELLGRHIKREQTDHRDFDVSPEEKEEIKRLAAGGEDDPFSLAADSLAPKLYGHDHIKQAIILALVGGSRVTYETGDFDRGEFHILLIGDPGTGKSKLIDRAEQVGWRTLGVSGKGATAAGITASATQDDFGDGDWSLSAGAFVAANRGVLCVDELDDMDPSVRAAMLEPMSKQAIHISKAGINATLPARTAVIAGANPKDGRFNTNMNDESQFGLEHNLLSRFDLVFTLKDSPDESRDGIIADHILTARDAAKQKERGEVEKTPNTPPVEPDLLRKWIALAKQQPAPSFEDTAVRDQLKEQFTSLRGIYGYNNDEPVPVTWRKLEGIVRVAEAAAKFEFSEYITERHAKIATETIGKSMQDFGKNADGNFDADVQEVGTSQSQRERKQTIQNVLLRMQKEIDHDPVAVDDLLDHLHEHRGINRNDAQHDIGKMKEEGEVLQPRVGYLKYIGRS